MSTIIPHEGERTNADMEECVDNHSTPAEESASASEGFGPLGLADFISPGGRISRRPEPRLLRRHEQIESVDGDEGGRA